MLSRCPSCAAEVADEAAQCPSCYWDFAAFKRIPPPGAEAGASPGAAPPEPPPEPKPQLPATGSARAELQMYSFSETEEMNKTDPPSSPKIEDAPPSPPPEVKKVKIIDFAEPEDIAKTKPPAIPEKKVEPPKPPVQEAPPPVEGPPPAPEAPLPPFPTSPPGPNEFGHGLKAEPSFSIPILPPSAQPTETSYSVGSIPALPPVNRKADSPNPASIPEFPKAVEALPQARKAAPVEIAPSMPPQAPPEPEHAAPPEKKREFEPPRTSMVKKAPPAKPEPSPNPKKKATTDPAARFKKKAETAPAARLKSDGAAGEELPIRWLAGGLAVVALGGGLAIFILTKPDSNSTHKTAPEAIFKKEPEAPQLPAVEKKPEPVAVPVPAPAAAVPPPPPAPEAHLPAEQPKPPAAPAAPIVAVAAPAPVAQPAPEAPPPAPEPKKKAGPTWTFEGRIYGLIDLESVYHAVVIIKDDAGNEVGRTISADEGRYSISVPPAASGGYQVAVQQPDYLELYIDEISPPFKSMEKDERMALKSGLSKAAARHQPWSGKTSKPTKRDLIMIPKLAQ